MTRGLTRAAADYDSSSGKDAQLASRRSIARMSIPARQELMCDPVFQMFRSATYIILMDKGINGENKRCEVSINCLMRGRVAAKAGRSFKHFFFFCAQCRQEKEEVHSFPSPAPTRVCVRRPLPPAFFYLCDIIL